MNETQMKNLETMRVNTYKYMKLIERYQNEPSEKQCGETVEECDRWDDTENALEEIYDLYLSATTYIEEIQEIWNEEL